MTGQSKLRVAILATLIAVAAPVFAGGYDDAEAGLEASIRGDYEKAIRLYSKAIESSDISYGNKTVAYSNRGAVYKLIGQWEKAVEDHNEAINRNPEFASAYNNLAWLYATCSDAKYRDGEKAVRLALKALEFSGSSDKWARHSTFAAALAEAERFSEAVKEEETAISKLKDGKEKSEAEERLELYKAGKPYREKVKKPHR